MKPKIECLRKEGLAADCLVLGVGHPDVHSSTIAKTQKPLKCPATDDCLRKMWDMCTVKY